MAWRPGKDYFQRWMDRTNLHPLPLSWVYLEKLSLLYIPIPKNASTQILQMLYELEHDHVFAGSANADRFGGNVHLYYTARFPPKPATELIQLRAKTTIVVARDPLQRLISAYRNRIVDQQSLINRRSRTRLLGLNPTPDLNQVMTKLLRYQFASPVFRQHSLPQALYLHRLWPHITDLYPMENLDRLQQQLFKGKSAATKWVINPSSSSENLDSPTAAALQRVTRFYAADYRLLRDFYSDPTITLC